MTPISSDPAHQPHDAGSVPAAPSAGLGRYLHIYAALWKNSVTREMGFKTNFILWIVVEMLWFALQLTFMSVIYSKTDRIGDWTRWEVIFLIGASNFIQQLFQAFFLTNCTQFPELIRTGRLDFMLLLPVNTRFLVSLRQVDLGGFVNGALALGVMGYALRELHLTPSWPQVVGFGALVVAGVLMHYSLMFLLTTVSFWTTRAQGIVWGYFSLFNIARMPDSAFRGVFKMVFTFILPVVLVANVPARLICQKLVSPLPMLLLVLLTVVAFVVSEVVWRFSVRRYTSASS